jgi:hypothetical protein
MKFSTKLLGLVLAALAFTALPAKADGLVHYDVNGQGLDFQFTLPQNLTPNASTSVTIIENNVPGTINNTPINFSIQLGTFFQGLPDFISFASSTDQLSLFAPGLFTWDGSTVDLATGTFQLGSYPDYLVGKYDYTLTATAVSTPEPSSLLLLGMGGLSLLGFTLRRKTA